MHGTADAAPRGAGEQVIRAADTPRRRAGRRVEGQAGGRAHGLCERISRRRREHLEGVLSADPAMIAARIVDGVLITSSMTDPDPARRSAAGALLGLRHQTPQQAEPGRADPRPTLPPPRDERPLTVALAGRGGDRVRPDSHTVEFDAPTDERCWGGGPSGGGCGRPATTEVGLCEDCLATIRARMEDEAGDPASSSVSEVQDTDPGESTSPPGVGEGGQPRAVGL